MNHEARYREQQTHLNAIAAKHGVVCFRPDYHGKPRDANTVLFYTKEDHAYNCKLDRNDWAPHEQYRK